MPTLTGTITESFAISDWRVTATKCKDGSLSGTTTTTGTGYSITTASNEPCNITLSPKIDSAWQSKVSPAVGDVWVPSNPDAMPHLYKAEVAQDPNLSSVSLLMDCEGANNATSATDSSPTPSALTFAGGAKLSTAQAKMGGSSLYLNGVTGSMVTAPWSSKFDFGAGDFTLEAWVYPLARKGVFYSLVNGSNSIPFVLTSEALDGSDAITCMYYNQSAWTVLASTATNLPPLNAWTHIAAVRSGNTVTLYLNGASVASGAMTGALPAAVAGLQSLRIGHRWDDGVKASFNGYIDGIRITKGIARYTAAFTPPGSYSGLTGTTEPTWPTGGTVVDGDVTWRYVAPLIDPITIGPKIPA